MRTWGRSLSLAALLGTALAVAVRSQQAPVPPQTSAGTPAAPAAQKAAAPAPPPVPVNAIMPPKVPLPPESTSAGITKFSFLAYGDTRGRRDGTEVQYEHRMVVDRMLVAIRALATTAYPVKFVLQSGDAVLNGRDGAMWNTSFVSLINRLTQDGGVPYFLAPGNHDVTTAADLESPLRKAGLANYLTAVSNLIPRDGAFRRLDGYPSYAFGFGNTFVLGLDSNIADDPKQFAWARGQLEGLDAARYALIIAFFHHPVFSSGPHGGSNVDPATAALREKYMPLFRAHRVRLLITGHEHLFEHWIERYTDTSGQARRLDEIVTGGGGAPLYAYQGEPRTADYVKAFAAEHVALEHLVRPGPAPGDNPYHFVAFKVDGESLSLDVIGVDWGTTFKPYRSNSVIIK